MNVRQLEAFRAFMATGTVTRAAEQMRISQPAVSQLINQLEGDCGFALFTRDTGRLRPTREAEALLVEVNSLFAGVQRVKRTAIALRDSQWGKISIASFMAASKKILPSIISEYSIEHPDVSFHLETMRSRHLLDAVASKLFDFGLSHLPADRDDVDSSLLHSCRAVCVLPATHHLAGLDEVDAALLEGERFISLGTQDPSVVAVTNAFDSIGVQRKIRIESGQSDTVCSFVANGLGVAVVDPFTVYDNADPRIVVRRFTPDVRFNLWLVTSRQAEHSRTLTHFLDYMRARLKVCTQSMM